VNGLPKPQKRREEQLLRGEICPDCAESIVECQRKAIAKDACWRWNETQPKAGYGDQALNECPNGPDEDGNWPCDPKGYFGVVECQTCRRIGVWLEMGRVERDRLERP